MLMQPENRDAIVFFGIVATAYLIIFGVLTPRIYYMVTHVPRRKNSEQTFEPVNLPTDSIVNTIVRQVRTLHILSLLLIIKNNNEFFILIFLKLSLTVLSNIIISIINLINFLN